MGSAVDDDKLINGEEDAKRDADLQRLARHSCLQLARDPSRDLWHAGDSGVLLLRVCFVWDNTPNAMYLRRTLRWIHEDPEVAAPPAAVWWIPSVHGWGSWGDAVPTIAALEADAAAYGIARLVVGTPYYYNTWADWPTDFFVDLGRRIVAQFPSNTTTAVVGRSRDATVGDSDHVVVASASAEADVDAVHWRWSLPAPTRGGHPSSTTTCRANDGGGGSAGSGSNAGTTERNASIAQGADVAVSPLDYRSRLGGRVRLVDTGLRHAARRPNLADGAHAMCLVGPVMPHAATLYFNGANALRQVHAVGINRKPAAPPKACRDTYNFDAVMELLDVTFHE
jgi:hypothetical protein